MVSLLQAGRLAGIAIFFVLIAVSRAQPVLVWDEVLDQDVDGYRVYFTDDSYEYPVIDVGRANSHTLTNLHSEYTYWIYVTAYNASFESEPSLVLQYPLTFNCTARITPNLAFASPWPENGSFRITAATACSWSVETTVPWIVITSPSVGSGIAEVSYSVMKNAGSYPREGQIKVLGQTFTIYQSAAGAGPYITQPLPASVTVFEGSELILNVLATEESTMRYQWYRNGSPMPNGTNEVYFVRESGRIDSGLYTVDVSSALRTVTAGPVEVKLYAKPAIIATGQPRSVLVEPGKTAVFRVDAIGSDLRYEWIRDGIPFRHNSPMLEIPAATGLQEGAYQVRVYNQAGSVLSDIAFLNVLTPQQIAGKLEVVDADVDSVTLRGEGVPGATYEVQGSSYFVSWFEIAIKTADASGEFFIEATSPNGIRQRFFRMVRK